MSNVTLAFSFLCVSFAAVAPFEIVSPSTASVNEPKWAQHVEKQAHLRRGTSFSACTGVSSADWQTAVGGAGSTLLAALAHAFSVPVWSLTVLWVPLVFVPA